MDGKFGTVYFQGDDDPINCLAHALSAELTQQLIASAVATGKRYSAAWQNTDVTTQVIPELPPVAPRLVVIGTPGEPYFPPGVLLPYWPSTGRGDAIYRGSGNDLKRRISSVRASGDNVPGASIVLRDNAGGRFAPVEVTLV